MKYAAFVDLFDTETAHIAEFESSSLKWNYDRKMYELRPPDVKSHYVFLGKLSDIKRWFNSFLLEKDEIKDTYEEAQRELIDAIFTQND